MFSTLKWWLTFSLVFLSSANGNLILKDDDHLLELEKVLTDIVDRMVKRHEVTCVAIICDRIYLSVFEGGLFRNTFAIPFLMIVVEEYDDLLTPDFYTLQLLKAARKDGCNVYVILLANGLQASRLLRFGDMHRILDTRAKYIMLHDIRLFHSDLHYLWKRIVNIIFIRSHSKINGIPRSRTWFDLSTVPFPNSIKGVLVPRRVDVWRNGKLHYNRRLFYDKTGNLNGVVLNVLYLDHVPSVVVTQDNETNSVGGVEVEILKTLAEKMNFKTNLYQPTNADLHKWGHKQPNGSFSGLLGEMVNGKADVALANLQYTPYHLELSDLSVPYTTQCWTFVTPEALTDNSWMTLILPFKLYLWITVLLVLLITGSIFHGLARYYINLEEYKGDHTDTAKSKSTGDKESEEDAKPVGLYLFGEIINSILYTYGMLLVVSLPKLPTGWSIRLLTGWYWLYCVLLVVSYRASMTAILANPAPRVTIDTLNELINSKVTCGGWGSETKRFFENSLDDVGKKINEKFEIIDNPDEAANRVAKGVYAYYDNENFLRYLSVKKKNGLTMETIDNTTLNTTDVIAVDDTERNLHVMSDCVLNIPISIGLHKNSPLKPLADVYVRRIVEVGLVEKWLNDVMYTIRSLDRNEEEIKALMNLKKLYGAFIALTMGYFFSTICLVGELIHWYFIVMKDPSFDKYAIDEYYKNKNKK